MAQRDVRLSPQCWHGVTDGLKMRILVVSCVFPPEPVTSASTSHAIACELAKRGHHVTALTSYPSRPGGRLLPGFRRRLFERFQTENGFTVIRCFSTTSHTPTLLSRLAENLSFGICSGLVLALIHRPDVIYANTWPIFAAGIATIVAKMRGIPIVVSVQDIYPESLVSLKKIKSDNFIARVLKSFDCFVARMAAALVVISERAENIYSYDRRVTRERIHRIANWRTQMEQPTGEMSRQQRINREITTDMFLFVFAGSVVPACGLDVVISAASKLKDDPTAKFIIAGSGSDLERCTEIAKGLDSENVDFIGPFLERQTLGILSMADVLVLPTQGDQSLVSMPSKLIAYMMAARPILSVACPESDLANVISTSGCGWVANPNDAKGLAELLRKIRYLDRAELERMGKAGREYALAHFSTEACLPKLIEVIENAGTHNRIFSDQNTESERIRT